MLGLLRNVGRYMSKRFARYSTVEAELVGDEPGAERSRLRAGRASSGCRICMLISTQTGNMVVHPEPLVLDVVHKRTFISHNFSVAVHPQLVPGTTWVCVTEVE